MVAFVLALDTRRGRERPLSLRCLSLEVGHPARREYSPQLRFRERTLLAVFAFAFTTISPTYARARALLRVVHVSLFLSRQSLWNRRPLTSPWHTRRAPSRVPPFPGPRLRYWIPILWCLSSPGCTLAQRAATPLSRCKLLFASLEEIRLPARGAPVEAPGPFEGKDKG